MIDKLGFLVRFWELKARHATLGLPLSGPEQLELLSLMQLVTGDFKMPAQLIGEGTILPVEVRYVCAAAMVIAGAKSMAPGERVIIRTADAVSGVEFAFPCSVAWVHEGTPCIMAVVVDGIPTRSEFAALPEPRTANVLSIGPQIRLVS